MVDTSYYPRAKGAVEAARQQLHARPNVHGVGLGPRQVNGEDTETLAIQVFVTKKIPLEHLDAEHIIPESIVLEDGSEIPTDVQQVDRFEARSGSESSTGVLSPRRTIHRPVPGGVSGGHPGVSGTLGGVFLDDQGRRVGLTNEHAATEAFGESPGSAFLQPSNSYTDVDQPIGTSVELSNIDPADTATNTSDSALIELDTGVETTGTILSVGEIGAPENPVLDITYLNSGMTSGLKASEVHTTDVSVTVNHPTSDEDAYFEGLVAFGGVTLPGDSGSVFSRYDFETGTAHPTALHFAASSTRSLAIPWSAVENVHGTLTPLADADTVSVTPTDTTRKTDAAPISMETNSRGQLEVLATPYGEPANMGYHEVQLREGAVDGPIIERVNLDTGTESEWGRPRIITFGFYDHFGAGTTDVAVTTGTGSGEVYSVTSTGTRDEYAYRATIEDAAGDPISGGTVTVRERDSTTQVATATTDSNGSVEIWLQWGEYTVSIQHPRYRTRVIDVAIEGTTEPTYTLDEYGDDIDTSTLTQVDTLTTSSAGEGGFSSLTHAGYVAEVEKSGYRTYTEQISHDGPQTITVDLEPTDISDVPTEPGVDEEGAFRPTVVTQGGQSISRVSVAIRERDSTTQVATAMTDSDGSVEIWLAPGEYTAIFKHDGYRTRIVDFSISASETVSRQQSLERYGGGHDTGGLSSVASLTTASAGEGAFQELTHGDYIAEIEKSGYRTYTTQVSHDSPGTLSANIEPENILPPPAEDGGGSGDGADNPYIDLPQADSFFEVTPLTSYTDESLRLPVLVANAGGDGDAAEIRLEGPTGRVTDRRTISLGAGQWSTIWMSARVLIGRSATIPASAQLTSGDQTENIDVYSGAEPTDVIGPGRPATMGGRLPATMGGRRPATLGRRREREVEPVEDIARVPGDWALTLINPADERRHEPVTSAPDPQLVHTELMDWTLDVPADPALEDWTFNTRAIVTFDEDVVFRGWCHEASSTTDGQTTTLSGTGPAGEITHGSVEQSFHHVFAWRAIEQFTDEFLPGWDWFVVPPPGDNSVLIIEDDVSGSPMECLTRLHDDYGMRFRVDNTRFRTAISFPAGAETTNTTSSFDVLSRERTQTSEGYANGVEVVGAARPAGGVVNESRYRAQYVDTDEVERLAAQLGVRESDAREIVQIRDSSIESDAQAQSRARAKTREFSQRNELGGTIETPARMYDPGIAYTLPWDDGQAVGSFAMQFTPTRGSFVDLPHRLFTELQLGGAITLWVRAPWSQLDDRESRLFGVRDLNNRGVRTQGAETLSLVMDDSSGNQATAAAFPEPDTSPPDNEWILVHYDWSYSSDAGETTLRAGINGEISDQATLDGVPAMPNPFVSSGAQHAWLGRWNDDYYFGRLDHVQMFDAPQSPARYREIARGNAIPATDLAAKYPLDEGPEVEQDGATVYDVFGSNHGTAQNVVSSGSPQTLENVDISGATASLEFRRTVTQNDAISHALREIRRMQ